MNAMELAFALKSARKRLGLDQEQLAKRLGVSRRTVTKLESGDGGVTRSNQRSAEYWLLHLSSDEALAELQSNRRDEKNERNRLLTHDSDARSVEPVVQNPNEVVRGHRALAKDEETVSLAFKVPASVAAELKERAQASRVTTSEFLRAVISEKLTSKE